MSQLLLSDLAALSTEAKRKSVDVRNASDVALAALRTNPQSLLDAKDDNAARIDKNILLQPIVLACQGKSAAPKIVGIAVGLLQRVIALHAIRIQDVAQLVNLLEHVVATRNDVEIQLKVLQCTSSFLSEYPSIHNDVLSKTLSLCFPLQASRVGVVSSTASATLRQAIMTVFEKVKEEDAVLDGIKAGGEDAAATAPLAAMTIPLHGKEHVTLFPCSKDAFLVVQDLNALANDENASFLQLESLPKTFTLELLESILTNHAALFNSGAHPELLLTLRQATCPLLIKAFNNKPSFKITLRLVRLIFVLLRQFNVELKVEVEILFSILIRFVAFKDKRDVAEQPAQWQRVLALEAIRSLAADGQLMRNLWKWFDAASPSAPLLSKLIDTLHTAATEDPSIVGYADAVHQLTQDSTGVQEDEKSRSRRHSGILNAAANALGGLSSTSDLSRMSNVGLSRNSSPSVQFIDQLDKSEAPSVPPTYVYLLSMQALVNFAQSLAAFALPVYSRFVNSRNSSAPRAPPALDFSMLAKDTGQEMLIVRDIVKQTSAALLDSLTFYISCNCDDFVFAEVLMAFRNFTNTIGSLGLASTRDAFVASLSRFAIPAGVLQKLLSMRNRTSATEDVEIALSERNAACLKCLTQIAYYLSGSIGTHWRDILETFCDAEYILRRSTHQRRGSTDSEAPPTSPVAAYKARPSLASIPSLSSVPTTFTGSAVDATSGRPQVLSQIDSQSLLFEIDRVFENSVALGEDALLPFLQALCELDADHSGLTSIRAGQGATSNLNRSAPLSSLSKVSMLNVRRLAESDESGGAWQLITDHMLAVCSAQNLRPALRLQAAQALDALVLAAVQDIASNVLDRVQNRAFEILAKQCILEKRRTLTVDIDVRRTGLECLTSIVETHGNDLRLGWETIFLIFVAACAEPATSEDRSVVVLVKTAFACMQVICSELLGKLDYRQLELCMQSLTQFGSQHEDINVALTAGGLLWGITAEVSSRTEVVQSDADENHDEGKDALWIYVLKNAQILTTDERLQARNGAISLLFNILEQYGPNLSQHIWQEEVLKNILLPLLDTLRQRADATSQAGDAEESKGWQESRILALTSTGKVVRQSLIDKIIDDKGDVWAALLKAFGDTFLQGPPNVSQAAIRAFHHIVHVNVSPESKARIGPTWRVAWKAWTSISTALSGRSSTLVQANLLTFVQTVQPLYTFLRNNLDDSEVETMLAAFRTVMTYPTGSERISDSTKMSALQAAITSNIELIIGNPRIVSRILGDLAHYSTLMIEPNRSRTASYLALSRTATESMLQIFRQHSTVKEVYESAAVESIFDALGKILNMRYNCPEAVSETIAPIWKSSMIVLCKIVQICCTNAHAAKLSAHTIAIVWSSMIDALAAALTADVTPILDLPIERQEDEEIFDVILLSTIEKSLLVTLGTDRVPTSAIVKLAETLSLSSRLVAAEARSRDELHSSTDEDEKAIVRKTSGYVADDQVPRENFSYWTLDLLLHMCSRDDSDVKGGDATSRRRVAALSLPALAARVTETLTSYIEDIKIRGGAPLARIREEELNFILARLGELRLWPGSLTVSASSDGQQFVAFVQGRLEGNATAKPKSSQLGLLFNVYPLLCELLLVTVPRDGGRFTTMRKATCGSSKLLKPRPLPQDFTTPSFISTRLHQDVGANHENIIASGIPELSSCRDLVYVLLAAVGQTWA